MPALYGRFFDPKQFAVPYGAAEEHLLDLVRWCELVLSAYLPCYAPEIRWAGSTEVVSVPSRPTMTSPMPVAVMTEAKEPPAPVISSTTPAPKAARDQGFFPRPSRRI